jgi:SAM-dependent methyltransferase
MLDGPAVRRQARPGDRLDLVDNYGRCRLPSAKDVLNATHGKLVFSRRVRVLSDILATTIPKHAKVLDVGTGDGSIAASIMNQRADLAIEGVDVFERPATQIPVTVFDGRQLPFADSSFDCVLFVDVLHHTDDAGVLVREAARVAKNSVVIKDHLLEGMFAGPTLRFMDWVGNRGHDVVLPYNYLVRSKWDQIFTGARLQVDSWRGELGLYPDPASWVFDRQLHFVARLTKT